MLDLVLKGAAMVTTTLKVRYANGAFEPLEELRLTDGEEVTLGHAVKARFKDGRLEPLGSLRLKEGEELSLLVQSPSFPGVIQEATDHTGEFLEKTAGAWKGLVDCDELIRRIYEDRERGSRDPIG